MAQGNRQAVAKRGLTIDKDEKTTIPVGGTEYVQTLNACVFSPDSLGDSLRILWRMIRKDFRADPCLFYKSGREFGVETMPPMPAQADGELLSGTPLTVRVDPLAGRLLIPKRN